MPLMREEVLKGHLMDQGRFGNTIRVHVSQETYRFLTHFRDRTNRTYHDLLRVIVGIYWKRPGFFDRRIVKNPKRRVLHVRLSRQEAARCLDEAWMKETDRAHFLGSLVNTFVGKVPKDKIIEAFENQLDRALRLLGDTNGH